MIIKLIDAEPKPSGVDRYARYLVGYLASGDRRLLESDAIGLDYGLTLSAYMSRAPVEPEPPRERVLFRGALVSGEPRDWAVGVEETERRLARRSRKVKKPVRHTVMSCRAEESLSEEQCVDAVTILARELGSEDAAIMWAAHGDTDNVHLHVMLVTVDAMTGSALPFGQEADGRAGY